MRLGLSSVDYTTWSNSVLDDAYAASYASGDSQGYTAIGQEIVTREASVSSFVLNLFGSRFPKFDAIQPGMTGGINFSDTARTAVATSAANVANSIDLGAKLLTIGAVIVAVAVIALKVKK
jgi:hypothetical protein